MIRKTDAVATLAAGTFAGAQLMIGITFGLQWQAMTGAELVQAFSPDWTTIAATIVPFALLLTVAIPLSLYQSRGDKRFQRLWIIALACWLTNCAITSIYHFPVVWTTMQGGYSPADIKGVIEQWVLIHWVRVALGYAVFLFAILATVGENTNNITTRRDNYHEPE